MYKVRPQLPDSVGHVASGIEGLFSMDQFTTLSRHSRQDTVAYSTAAQALGGHDAVIVGDADHFSTEPAR